MSLDPRLMPEAQGDAPLVLSLGLKRWAVFTLVMLAFAGAGAWLGVGSSSAGNRTWGFVAVAFFGLAAGVQVLRLILRDSLTLSTGGFTIRNLGRQRTVQWSSVAGFRIFQPSRMREIQPKSVVYFYAEEAFQGRGGFAMSMARALGGTLPDNYGLKAEDLAALMTLWRARYAAAS